MYMCVVLGLEGLNFEEFVGGEGWVVVGSKMEGGELCGSFVRLDGVDEGVWEGKWGFVGISCDGEKSVVGIGGGGGMVLGVCIGWVKKFWDWIRYILLYCCECGIRVVSFVKKGWWINELKLRVC